MQILIVGLWLLQGSLMFVDEFKFHRERGLKKWERLGHPIDSLFFLIPFLYTMTYIDTQSQNLYSFIGLCGLSCLTVTKDEFIHAEECAASEHWLHSVLFIIHPVALFGLWLAWKNNFQSIIQVQSTIIFLFMLYQIIYWNFGVGAQNEAES